jgi:hypothetical protein
LTFIVTTTIIAAGPGRRPAREVNVRAPVIPAIDLPVSTDGTCNPYPVRRGKDVFDDPHGANARCGPHRPRAIGLPVNRASGQEKHKFSFIAPPGTSTYTQQHEIEVGDVPGHKVRIYEIRAKYTSEAPTYAGVKVVEGWTRASSDHTNGSGRTTGYGVSILENGDKIFSRFETLVHTVVESDGSRKSAYTSVSTLTGGTGKFTTIRGTLRGAGSTDFKSGLSGVKTEGEYWFEK